MAEANNNDIQQPLYHEDITANSSKVHIPGLPSKKFNIQEVCIYNKKILISIYIYIFS